MMKCNRFIWLMGMLALASISSSCQLKQGKLYFDEIGLDPITVYKMAPLEQTVYCLSEIKELKSPVFAEMHAAALQDLRQHPEQEDWSELICLSLSGEADKDQLQQTMEALDIVLSRQQQQSNPLQGFRRIIQARLELYSQIDNKEMQIELLKKDFAEQEAAFQRSARNEAKIRKVQREKISELEQQVRKLKEVELLLHPKQ